MTKKSYVLKLNNAIDSIMFIVAGRYQREGPTGGVDYDIMCGYIRPEAMKYLGDLVGKIRQDMTPHTENKDNNHNNWEGFCVWYKQACKEAETYERKSASFIFKKILNQ